MLAGAEALTGLTLGLGVLVLFSGVQVAGQLISQMSGMQLSDVFDPGFDTHLPVFSQLLYLVTLAVFVAIGGHRRVIEALLDTFVWMPTGQGVFSQSVTAAMTSVLSQSFVLGVRAAAPAMMALVLATLILGLASRTLPQLNVMVLGFGASAAVTLAVVGVSLGAAAWLFADQLEPARDGFRHAAAQLIDFPRACRHMAEFDDEKTLDPTPHRRQQARAAGQVPRSADLSSAGLLLGGLLVLVFTGGALLEFLAGFLTSSLGGQSWQTMLGPGGAADADAVASQWNPFLLSLAKVLLPPLALVTLLGVALNIMQTGFLFLPQKLSPDLARVNPIAGLGRLFSGASAARLTFGVGKLAVIVAVAWASVYPRREELLSIGALDLPEMATCLWDVCFWTCAKMGGALAALAVVDYGLAYWRHERDLKMTPAELREELRNLQGDPQQLARRRAAQRQTMAARRTT